MQDAGQLLAQQILQPLAAFCGRSGQDRGPVQALVGQLLVRPCRRGRRQAGHVAQEWSVDGAGMKVAPLPPIDRNHRRLRSARFQQLLQSRQALFGREGLHALRSEAAAQVPLGPSHHADLVPESPIDAQRRLAHRPPVVRQGVQKSVRRRVTPQQGRSQQRRPRRKTDKEIQPSVGQQIVQHPTAGDLRTQHAAQLVIRQLQDRLRGSDPGGVNHTPDRRQAFGLQPNQQVGQGLAIGDVQGGHPDADPGRLELADLADLPRAVRVLPGNLVPLPAGRQRAAAEEDQGPRAARHQPLGNPQPQVPQSSADQITGIAAAPQLVRPHRGGSPGHQPGRIPLIPAVGHLILVVATDDFAEHPQGTFPGRHGRIQVQQPAPHGRQFFGDDAAQPPQGRLGQAGQRLSRDHGLGTLGDQPQPGVFPPAGSSQGLHRTEGTPAAPTFGLFQGWQA